MTQGVSIESTGRVALNEKEKLVLRVLANAETVTIPEMATSAFPSAETPQASSWVRNSLRKLVRGRLVEKPQRGIYTITNNGQAYLAKQ